MAPFGGECEFADMDACIAANQDKDDPGAWCATLMRETEEHCAGRSVKLRGIQAKGQHYEVKLTTEPIGGEEGEQSFLGQTQEATNIIVIDGTMPKSRQEEVLLHELLHIADMTVPEFAINSLGQNLYGILRENDLLPDDMVPRMQSGTVAPAEMARLHKHNEDLEQQMGMLRISEKPWLSLVVADGKLVLREPDGTLNRTAVHLAATAIIHGTSIPDRRHAAKELLEAYRAMNEAAPQALKLLAR